jgi:hypothetical protein
MHSLPQANWASVWMIPLSGSPAEAGMFWRHFFQLKLKETLLLTCHAICGKSDLAKALRSEKAAIWCSIADMA